MIRTIVSSDTGPILVLGITDENLRRLTAGMPIDVDIAEMLRVGPFEQVARIVIVHGRRHIDIVQDMKTAKWPVPPILEQHARELDAQLERERR